MRISAIDCGVAAGPAKYTAGSPGSTRVSRNVTMTTPISVGITVDEAVQDTRQHQDYSGREMGDRLVCHALTIDR